jgi:hypothetical protein
MSGSKKDPQEWLPLYIDRYKTDDNDSPLTQEEVNELQDELADMNRQKSDT